MAAARGGFGSGHCDQGSTVLAVVDAPSSELATQATAALVEKLSGQNDLFHSVTRTRGGQFFRKNGLLFLPTQQVVETTRSSANPRR